MVILEMRNDEHRCSIKFSEKNLETMLEEYKNVIVDHSLIRLRVGQMRKALSQQKNMLYDTESHRTMLQAAVKEKRSEIEAHSRLLELKKRGVKEELSVFKCQLSQVSSNLDKRRKRYEIVMKLMAKPEETDPDSEEIKSEAYYILKMAQEREFLRMEGDNWDKKVKEAEIETEALQNSLSLIQCSNDLFKDSLKPVADEASLTEMNRLKQQEKECVIRKHKAVTKLRKLEEEIQSKITAIEVAEHQKVHCDNKAVDKEYEVRVLGGELRNQALSAKRARMLTNKLLQELAFSSSEQKDLVSSDIKLKATRRKFEFSIQSLAKLLNVYPTLYETIGQLLCKQFGEQIAVKFLNRVSPMLGDCLSPSGSQYGTGRRGSPASGTIPHKASTRATFMESASTIMSASRPTMSVSRPTMSASRTTMSVSRPTMSASRAAMSSKSWVGGTTASRATSIATAAATSKISKSSRAMSSISFLTSEPAPAAVELDFDGAIIPERTESEKELLQNIATAVQNNRQQIVEERQRMEIAKNTESFGRKLSATKSVTDIESSFIGHESVESISTPSSGSSTSIPSAGSSSGIMLKKKLMMSSSGVDLAQILSGDPDIQRVSSEGILPQEEKLDSIAENPEENEGDEVTMKDK